MKLAVIILNYRTADMTIDSIIATLKALMDAEFSWTITVVDNNSGDGSEEKIRELCTEKQQQDSIWKRIEVIQSGHNGGFGAGNNFGIRHVLQTHQELEYVYILNSDAFPDKDAIIKLVEFLDANEHYGYAGSYIYGTDGEPHTTAFRFPSAMGELEGAIRFGPISKLLKKYIVPIGIPDTSIDVDWLAGASLMMRVKTILQVGLFDETFFLYFEETDLLQRAARQGWKTRYLLESKVAHVGSASTGMKKWDRIPTYWLDSRRHYFTKNYGQYYFYWATACKLLGQCLWGLRCLVTRKKNPEPLGFGWDLLKHALKKTVND